MRTRNWLPAVCLVLALAAAAVRPARAADAAGPMREELVRMGFSEEAVDAMHPDLLRDTYEKYGGKPARVIFSGRTPMSVAFSDPRGGEAGPEVYLNTIAVTDERSESIDHVDVIAHFRWQDRWVRPGKDALIFYWDDELLGPVPEREACRICAYDSLSEGSRPFFEGGGEQRMYAAWEEMLFTVPVRFRLFGKDLSPCGFVRFTLAPHRPLAVDAVGKDLPKDLGLSVKYLRSSLNHSAEDEYRAAMTGQIPDDSAPWWIPAAAAAFAALIIFVVVRKTGSGRGERLPEDTSAGPGSASEGPGLPGREEVRKKDSELCEQCLAYLREHTETDFSWREMAGKIGYSEPYLKKRFRAETGKSLAAALREMRMEKAAAYLAGTDMTVGEIAEILKFSSAGAFRQAFEEAKGQTPSQYRKDRRQRRSEGPEER